jgi:hypothetical protein
MKIEVHTSQLPSSDSSRDTTADARRWIAELDRAWLDAFANAATISAGSNRREQVSTSIHGEHATPTLLPIDTPHQVEPTEPMNTQDVASARHYQRDDAATRRQSKASLTARGASVVESVADRAHSSASHVQEGVPGVFGAQDPSVPVTTANAPPSAQAVAVAAPLSVLTQKASLTARSGSPTGAQSPKRSPRSASPQDIARTALRVVQPDDQRLLLTLRDASLSPAQAVVLAESLARAAAQMGYERAQAYVNGSSYQHISDARGPRLAAEALAPARPVSSLK